MNKILRVQLCRTHDNKPLTTIDGLPGDMADLRPSELRALAATLVRIAADCEVRPMGPRSYRVLRAQYTIEIEQETP
jgi:hypothetical protein